MVYICTLVFALTLAIASAMLSDGRFAFMGLGVKRISIF
jgi:hypothetical protein